MSRAELLAEAARLASEARVRIDERGGNHPTRTAENGRCLVRQLEALRLTAVALCEPVELVAEEQAQGEPCFPDPVWARVELFGHSVVYGLVGEVFYAGRTFLEVTTPALWANELQDGDPDFPESSKRYHPNAVYALSEQPAGEVIETLRRQRGLCFPVREEEYVPRDDDFDDDDDHPF